MVINLILYHAYNRSENNTNRFQPDYTQKIDDLYTPYQYASENIPNEETVAELHRLLAKHIVSVNWLGRFRNQNMYVTTKDGRIEYVAASPYEVPFEMAKLYADINTLLNTELSVAESFFFASMIHLVFVKIQPWNDGNGRSARLLEKWFLARKLGDKAWFMQSEKHLLRISHLLLPQGETPLSRNS